MSSRSETTSTILEQHRLMVLPQDQSDRTRVIVRRSSILQDSLHLFRNRLDVTKHLRVTFVNEPAVDEGGPLREYFRLLLCALQSNNSLFSGPD